MIYQQLLPIEKLQGKMQFSNFFSGPNKPIIKKIENALTFSNLDRQFFLKGEKSSGKTHLAFSTIDECLKSHKVAYYLDGKDLPQEAFNYSEFQNILKTLDVFIVDHLECILPSDLWETFLFNIFNHFRNENKFLLIISDTSLKNLNFKLPDLQSRLFSCWLLNLNPLSDEEKCHALQNMTNRYGLKVQEEAFKFLLNRFSRDMSELVKALEQLDKFSMRIQKPLTIPVIRQWLENKNKQPKI